MVSILLSAKNRILICCLAATCAGLYLVGGIVKAQSCGGSCPESCSDFSPGVFAADQCQYPSGGCPSNYYNSNGCCYNGTPIVVDVDGDGFALTSASNGVMFDLFNDAHPVKVSWTTVNSDDAWLALDRNGNGVIDNGSELFGNVTPQPPSEPGQTPNGFIALGVYDLPENGGNGDGMVDKRDSVYRKLLLWQDKNHNGYSEENELHSLHLLGIAGLHLNYKQSLRQDQYGNVFRFRAKVVRVKQADDGRWAWDVFLRTIAISTSSQVHT